MNIFKNNWDTYISKGYSVIPDKWASKSAAIKDWTQYGTKLPKEGECEEWSNFLEQSGSGISLMTGERSGVIALDIDETRPEILELINPILPSSPVVKEGAKGETRFFKFSGEVTNTFKFNNEMVLELLSTGKKTTLPPSRHPSGVDYRWTTEETLLTINKNDLPLFPPFLFPQLELILKSAFPSTEGSFAGIGDKKLINGRNDALGSLCGKLIQERMPIEEAIKLLIEEDRNSSIPLFSDPEEQLHTEVISNALKFYSNHLNSINTKRFRENKEYEVPSVSVGKPLGQNMEKSKSQKKEKKALKLPIPAHGVLKTFHQNVLDNSWIKQDAFALSAGLVLLSTLVSRKITFQGMSPNLYVLNIAPSGSGKNSPQEVLKKTFLAINCHNLLGAGDYVSDASLMDQLNHQPVRLDIMDEVGSILKSMNAGKNSYDGKMADILTELYTSSNGYYLGRNTSEGRKGNQYRPNVNILASTTPAGFSEGVTMKALEKGLLGRFIIFIGNGEQRAERLRHLPALDIHTINRLRFWANYEPEENEIEINGIPQMVTELKATNEAEDRLDEIFEEFDLIRREADNEDPLLPIISRLYQQMIKIVMVHCASRANNQVPDIELEDVNFGYDLITYYFSTMREVVEKYIFESHAERNVVKVLMSIPKEGVSKTDLFKRTRGIAKRERESIIQDLIDNEQIFIEAVPGEGRTTIKYKRL